MIDLLSVSIKQVDFCKWSQADDFKVDVAHESVIIEV